MTDAEIEAAVLQALARVAPELDTSAILPDVRLRDQVDIDSMDFLNFMVELHSSLGVDVPEADYSKLVTLRDCVAYLSSRVGADHPVQPPA